ncbi:hypothetical protein RSOLAG1IB_10600 [Rhizoctonia solani AG-1 IB]|uniref:Uncharacterized protein n=1 Tax=Thanatephorus cucumeris (strain AG1-IB / isolate 7/3/14) TaxID=1108050 RepID=A0A0B7FYB7_THACB|nr:hypothetical protein RSOLAG1IB_10600 [Rhizoctonia solani AG-1 IB]
MAAGDFLSLVTQLGEVYLGQASTFGRMSEVIPGGGCRGQGYERMGLFSNSGILDQSRGCVESTDRDETFPPAECYSLIRYKLNRFDKYQ